MSRDYTADGLRDIGCSEDHIQATMLYQLYEQQKRTADALERIADSLEPES